MTPDLFQPIHVCVAYLLKVFRHRRTLKREHDEAFASLRHAQFDNFLVQVGEKFNRKSVLLIDMPTDLPNDEVVRRLKGSQQAFIERCETEYARWIVSMPQPSANVFGYGLEAIPAVQAFVLECFQTYGNIDSDIADFLFLWAAQYEFEARVLADKVGINLYQEDSRQRILSRVEDDLAAYLVLSSSSRTKLQSARRCRNAIKGTGNQRHLIPTSLQEGLRLVRELILRT